MSAELPSESRFNQDGRLVGDVLAWDGNGIAAVRNAIWLALVIALGSSEEEELMMSQ
jgi:hypothetical protein